MNGNNIITDTNILLYLLSGDKTLAEILDQKQVYISFITELELLGYKNISKLEQKKIKEFLKECLIVDINSTIKEYAIQLKQKYSIKLPDSIILATSLFLNIPLITADNEMQKIKEVNLIYYQK
jgi:predicted nucleic acid-binding protein